MNYLDYYGVPVELVRPLHPTKLPIKHVLVLVRSKGQWLLTKNLKRGYEFPGGKVEQNEEPSDAAIRETLEETGVHIRNVQLFASYVVQAEEPFHKAVYTAEYVEQTAHFLKEETEGAFWFTEEELQKCTNTSFLMRDVGNKQLRNWVVENE